MSGTITYYWANGTAVGITQNFTIYPHGSQPFYQGAANLPTGFYGSAEVSQAPSELILSNSLMVTTNAQTNNLFYTYNEPNTYT